METHKEDEMLPERNKRRGKISWAREGMGSKYLPQVPSEAVVSLLSYFSEVDTTDSIKQCITDETENHLQHTRPSAGQRKIYFVRKFAKKY